MKLMNKSFLSKINLLFFALILTAMLPLLFSCSNDDQQNGDEGGQGHIHAYTEKLPWIKESIVTAGSCTEEGVYYYVCSCGAVGNETYTAGLEPHQFSERIEDALHLASEATCMEPSRYYYDCTVCSAISDELTFSSGDTTDHKYVDNVCVYGCNDELNKYTLSEDEEYYTLTSYRENTPVVTVPATYKGLPVKAIGEHAFSSINVKEIILPPSVERIDDLAFYGHGSLEKINLEAVLYVGDYAFYNCEKLTDISLSSAITLGEYCFSKTGLSEITVPEGVIEIGTDAFSKCVNLTKMNYLAVNCKDLDRLQSIIRCQGDGMPYISLYIGSKVEKIPDNAFTESSIREIVFANDSLCRTIGNRAFFGIRGEMALALAGIETIGEFAFAESEITDLTLGKQINVIGSSAFADCKKLTKVTIEENRGGFGDNLFANGAEAVDVYYLHNGNETLGRALWNCNTNLIIGKDVKTIPSGFEEGGVVTLRFEEGASDVSIGERAFISSISGVLDLSPVTVIGSQAFYRTGIDAPAPKVIIGKELKSIGGYVFGNLQELLFNAESCNDVIQSDITGIPAAFISADSVIIGKNVKRIPGDIFSGAKLKSISFENGSACTEIGERAFYHATIPGFSLPSTVKTVGAYAFEGASGVTEKLNLNGVTSFGEYAFRSYVGEIDLSNSSASTIASYAFNGANVTGQLTFETVTVIEAGAFLGCTGITKLVFGERFKSAGSNAFSGCTGITEVVFNAVSANDLTSPIFSNNGSMRAFQLTIGNSVKKIPDYMFSSSAVSSVTFEADSACSSIGRYAFSHTYRLELAELLIPDSVERIEESAFALTKANTIILGKGIKYIGNGAFWAMGIIGEEEHGFIEKIYFTATVTLVATEIASGEKENLVFEANSEENAPNYAKILYRAGYIYEAYV